MENQNNNPQTENNANTENVGFYIQRIYVKDVSFEVPNAPEIFMTQWEPKINLNLETKVNTLLDNNYEVILNTSVTTIIGEEDNAKTAFICEVQQAGIFNITGIDEDQLSYVLLSECPTILFPYARALISQLVAQGSFPQLNLEPINFEAIYMQRSEEKNKEDNSATH